MDRVVSLYHFVIFISYFDFSLSLSTADPVQVFRNPFVIPCVAKNKKNSLLFRREVEKNWTKIHSVVSTTFARQCSGRELFYFV